MSFLLDPAFWARWFSIVIIDLALAGDNAIVIALAVRTLPRRQQFLGRMWGSAGAVGLRLLFIAIITYLLKLPLLQLFGGLVLIWIAVKLVRQGSDEGEGEGVRHGSSLWEAIWIIIVADVTMSLDNVLAVAAAAHGNLLLVIFGISLSIPLVVWGSGILAHLMNRFEWLVWLGGGILGFVSGEMVVGDSVVKGWLGEVARVLHYPVPIVLGVGIFALGWWVARTARHRALIPEEL
ncbi:MAG: TerC family protein [candidate division NC10 bacterium]